MRILSDPHRISDTGRIVIAALTLTGAGLLLSGCPGGAELDNAQAIYEGLPIGSGDGDMATYCDAMPIFVASCGLATSCHLSDGANPPAGGVDLVNGDVGAALLGVPASYPDLSCGSGEQLINPGAVDESLLLKKLNGTHTCGTAMPVGLPLPARDISCIRDWAEGLIAGGAPMGTGGTSMGTGGDAMGTGGDVMGSGGDGMGTGGDTMGSGGSSASVDPITLEAECAFGFGCPTGVTGSATGDAVAENDNTTVGYLNTTASLTYAGIAANGQDTITFTYSKENADGALEIRQDSAAGTLLGTFTPENTGTWSDFMEGSVTLSAPLSGNVTIVLVPTHPTDGFVCNLDTIELSAGSAQ